MTVMLRGVPAQYEPTLKNRFEVVFPQERDLPSWLVQTAGKPKFEQDAIEIPYMNTSSYVAGRYKWGTITLKFINPIGPSTEQKNMEWVRLQSESLTGRMGYAAGYKTDILINTLDPTGVTISTWKLYECQITAAEFDELDYSAGELVMPTLVLQPYYCELSY